MIKQNHGVRNNTLAITRIVLEVSFLDTERPSKAGSQVVFLASRSEINRSV